VLLSCWSDQSRFCCGDGR